MVETIQFNTNQPVKSSSKKIPIIVGVVLIIGAIVAYLLINQEPKTTEEPKDTVVENQTPTPTEKPKVDKSTVNVQVLNGTGTPGQAGTVVEALTKAGYVTDKITTDNADNYDFTVTTIEAKDGFEDIASDIKIALKDTFDEIKIDSTNLDADSDYDIVVTTGGKKFEAATPTPSANPTESLTTTPITTPTLTPTVTPTPTP